ncbi:MAG TPA: DUF2298 domain-containing protein [Dehalococcoidia bacterium]|nr:DUF2298 domain-containing protein [Dehalococcoidia bacterium]
MKETLLFWLTAQAAALAALPLCCRFFRGLPDRGYAFSKPLGVMALGYLFWLGAMLRVWPSDRGGVLLALLLLACASLAAAGGRGREAWQHLRRLWPYLVLVECLFLSAFLFGAYLRSFVPELVWGEKPFELAFLNAVIRSDSFPPRDPWLAGHSINYYYFGYVEAAALAHLSGIGASTVFWLMLCLVAALAAVGAFGLAYNLVALQRGRALDERAAVFGLLAVGLLLLVGNLEGVFELLARHGLGNEAFYRALGIAGLDGPYDCAARPQDCRAWYPTAFWWWWKATRMGSPYEVQEFPIFSFQFGDLHPHVLALPTTLVATGAALQLFLDARSSGSLPWQGWQPWRPLAAALVLGAAAVTDMWALATFLGLAAGAVGVGAWSASGRLSVGLGRGITALAVLGAGIVVLYLPFFLTVEASGLGLAVNQAWQAQVSGYPPVRSVITRPVHFLLFWLPMLVLPTGALLRARGQTGAGWMTVLPWTLPLLAWASYIFVSEGLGRTGPEPSGLAGEAAVRLENGNWLTIGLLALLLTRAARWLQDGTTRAGAVPSGAPAAFASWATLLALMLLLGAELFFVRDLLGFRYNTVFRFWYHAWTLLAVAGAYAAHELLDGVRLPSRESLGRAAWAGLAACVLAGGLAFTVLVVAERTEGLSRSPRGLDALAYLAQSDPEEYLAARWLNENVRGTPTVLEATGGPYSDFARISSRTGLPTVLGWANHEVQWRGGYDLLLGRAEDVERIYLTQDLREAQALMSRYNVQFVVVGRVEREAFVERAPAEERARRETALAKFGLFMEVAFQAGDVTVYRLPQQLYVLGTGRGQEDFSASIGPGSP